MNGPLFCRSRPARAGRQLRGRLPAQHADCQTAEAMKRFEPVIDGYMARARCWWWAASTRRSRGRAGGEAPHPGGPCESRSAQQRPSHARRDQRILTDQISDVLYTTERSAYDNSRPRRHPRSDAVFVGNVMIDSLRASLRARCRFRRAARRGRPGRKPDRRRLRRRHLHRPSNVDSADTLGPIIDALRTVSEALPLVVALHPRTRNNLERWHARSPRRLRLPDPAPQGSPRGCSA